MTPLRVVTSSTLPLRDGSANTSCSLRLGHRKFSEPLPHLRGLGHGE